MTLTVRDYRAADRAHLARCLDTMMDHLVDLDPWRRLVRGAHHAARYVPFLLAQARKNGGFVLVAEVGGRPAGIAVAWVRRFTAPEREAEAPTRVGYLSDLAVLPEWRGRGIAG